jgi:hypothetical protein
MKGRRRGAVWSPAALLTGVIFVAELKRSLIMFGYVTGLVMVMLCTLTCSVIQSNLWAETDNIRAFHY